MHYLEGKLGGARGTHLHTHRWLPAGEPVAIIALIHGVGEHCGRYHDLARFLTAKKCAVYAFDQRGHGKSADSLCAHIDSWSDYREDLLALVKSTNQNPQAPLFLLGHSMGGLVALDFALHYPEKIRGVICSAPALHIPKQPFWIRVVGNLMSKIKPNFRINITLKPEAVSGDPAEIERYKRDPLIHNRVSARWGMELMETAQRIARCAAQFQTPLLIYHGGDDRIVPAEASQNFITQMSSDIDRELIVYPGGMHESHHDLHRQQTLNDTWKWISHRL